ncbi:hypothetical protein PC118_g24090 [Phytophthora cactorum]|uniref:Uncharacterized protein n=1 Tax=Phytophthora cactorum TaxID=29920 RepID=A0A8T1ENL1_9STRA|nr:hypothetical protein PC113_g23872 [Phytophthora cactorum]KAG2957295.1 hypothetical protein PC118_g24090 [Phytophthora cactorum]
MWMRRWIDNYRLRRKHIGTIRIQVGHHSNRVQQSDAWFVLPVLYQEIKKNRQFPRSLPKSLCSNLTASSGLRSHHES